jgi:hypothetical protein
LSQDTKAVHVSLEVESQFQNSGWGPCEIFLQYSDEGAPLLHLFVFQGSKLVSPTSVYEMLSTNTIIFSENQSVSTGKLNDYFIITL